jgi:hypothetical protein
MKWYELPALTSLTDDCKILVWDAVSQSSRTVKLSTLKTYLGTSTTPTSTTKQLTFSSSGDTNGLAYFLGTNKGVAAWQNPHNNGLVMSASATEVGTVNSLVDRQASEFYSPNSTGNWVKLTISSGTLKCNYYSIRNRSNTDHYLRNWKLQGSNDDSTWTDLNVQTNNTTLASASQWLSLPVTSTTAYKYFRLLMTGVNSANYYYLCLGELELYGTYTY